MEVREPIRIVIKEGTKAAEALKKLRAEKNAFREAVQSGKMNEYAKKHPNTTIIDADTLQNIH